MNVNPDKPPGKLLDQLRPWGVWAALLGCLLNLVWLGSMIALAQLGPPVEQAAQAPWLFRVSLGACVVLTLLQLPILLALGLTAAERSQARALLGGAAYALYIPLNLAAYYLFGMVFPRLAGAETGVAELQPLLLALDIGQPYALFGNLPILGYGLLGLAWCLLGTAVFRRSRLWAWAAVFMLLSGGISAVGAVGNFVDLELVAVGTMVGGVISVPALALVAAALWRDNRAASR